MGDELLGGVGFEDGEWPRLVDVISLCLKGGAVGASPAISLG